jgi:Na+-transporting NADH:ubiquinone oxidoreductase subunit NqrC
MDQVDAISGGTITSKGVEAMLKSSLEPYKAFMLSGAATAAPASEQTLMEPTATDSIQ